MRIKIWGCRGSIASPASPEVIEDKIRNALANFCESDFYSEKNVEDFISSLPRKQLGGYGGNTTCVEVNSGKEQIIIDCGTGIRLLSEELMKGPCGKGKGIVHIYLTHYHWDHIAGLPFFAPLYIPGNTINFYAVGSQELESAIKLMFAKPYFPVPFEALPTKVTFTDMEPRKPFYIKDIEMIPYLLDHPDPCWGLRVNIDGKSYSHCVDNEGVRVSESKLGEDIGLYRETDVLYYDAQYSFKEYMQKVDWGHGTAPIGLDLARREKVKKVIFTHHDPTSSDEYIAKLEQDTINYNNIFEEKNSRKGNEKSEKSDHVTEFEFAYEGLTIEL